jgi:hypothetical protein
MGSRILLATIAAVTALLVALKLTHVIHWSWLWVLAPLWIPGLYLLIGIVLLLALFAAASRMKW